MSKPFIPLCLLASLALASCSTILNNLPGVYTLEIQQGNIVDQDMIDQLRPGMTQRQVLYIMGSPMLVDTFHPKRWDYVYYDKTSGEDKQQKRLSLFFNREVLAGIQGDLRPSATPAVKAGKETTINVPKRNLEKTLWEKITGLFEFNGDDPEAKQATNAAGGEDQ